MVATILKTNLQTSRKIVNQSINQSIYLFVLCFKTKNTPIYVKKSFRKHRNAFVTGMSLIVTGMSQEFVTGMSLT